MKKGFLTGGSLFSSRFFARLSQIYAEYPKCMENYATISNFAASNTTNDDSKCETTKK